MSKYKIYTKSRRRRCHTPPFFCFLCVCFLSVIFLWFRLLHNAEDLTASFVALSFISTPSRIPSITSNISFEKGPFDLITLPPTEEDLYHIRLRYNIGWRKTRVPKHILSEYDYLRIEEYHNFLKKEKTLEKNDPKICCSIPTFWRSQEMYVKTFLFSVVLSVLTSLQQSTDCLLCAYSCIKIKSVSTLPGQ